MISRRAYMTRALAGLGVAAAWCIATRTSIGAKMTQPLTLDWTLSPGTGGKSLRISYTVTNHSKSPIWVLDKMVVLKDGKFHLAPERVIVQQTESAGVAALVRGWVRSVNDVTVQFIPGSQQLDPGKLLQGAAEVPLPLSAWHPNGNPPQLKGSPTQVVLEIGYLTGEPDWTHPPIDDGTHLLVPKFSYTFQHQQFVRSAAKSLPSA